MFLGPEPAQSLPLLVCGTQHLLTSVEVSGLCWLGRDGTAGPDIRPSQAEEGKVSECGCSWPSMPGTQDFKLFAATGSFLAI